MTRTHIQAAMATLLLGGCGATIQGGWEASGHLQTADAFELALSFDDDRAAGVFTSDHAGDVPIPVCKVKVDDDNVAFVIGTSAEQSCSTLSHPLSFLGVLGRHVITGTIRDASGAEVGMWRAYRKQRE